MMRRDVTRRISTLERAIPLPMTSAVIWARAEEHARLTGTSWESAVEFLAGQLSEEELIRLIDEAEQIVSGGNNNSSKSASRRLT
jgi:hypothetical protein